MKTIRLTQGLVTIVDDEDFEFLSQWKWHAKYSRGLFYAARSVLIGKKVYRIFMHRVLKGAVEGQGVDHRDRHTLNNQKHNLRFANQSQNNANSKLRKDNSSGFKGVVWQASRKRWVSQVRKNGKWVACRSFKTKEEAAEHYDESTRSVFGDFAATNQSLRTLN